MGYSTHAPPLLSLCPPSFHFFPLSPPAAMDNPFDHPQDNRYSQYSSYGGNAGHVPQGAPPLPPPPAPPRPPSAPGMSYPSGHGPGPYPPHVNSYREAAHASWPGEHPDARADYWSYGRYRDDVPSAHSMMQRPPLPGHGQISVRGPPHPEWPVDHHRKGW